MTIFLTIVHVFVCLFLIGVVLLQSGRAGGMGVLSGAATQTVFGGRGAGSFLQRVTAICAIVFIITCSTLAWMASATRDRGLRNAAPPPAAPARNSAATRPAGSASTGTGGAGTNAAAPASDNADNGTGPAPTTQPAPAAPANGENNAGSAAPAGGAPAPQPAPAQ